jgi:hypothetical protein
VKKNILFFISFLLIVGCNCSIPNNKIDGTTTPTEIPTGTTEPSETVNTITPKPSQTTTEVIPTRTPTQLPTFTEQEINLFTQKVLLPDEECKLPCWWGIVPGKSTKSQLMDLLQPLNSWGPGILQKDGTIVRESGFLEGDKEGKESSVVIVVWRYKEETIIQIVVTVHIYDEHKSDAVFFFPRSILELYGEPDRILLDVYTGGDMSGYVYTLGFFYSSLGFNISYMGDPISDHGVHRICPSFSGTGNLRKNFVLNLQTPGITYEASGDDRDISEVTEYSKEEFYLQMLTLGDAFCFNTSEEFWK